MNDFGLLWHVTHKTVYQLKSTFQNNRAFLLRGCTHVCCKMSFGLDHTLLWVLGWLREKQTFMKNKKLDLMTTREVAADIGRPVSTIQRWMRDRKIPYIDVGWRTKLFDPEEVRKALLRKTVRELED
jgi:excisionase family DNA binding protein